MDRMVMRSMLFILYILLKAPAWQKKAAPTKTWARRGWGNTGLAEFFQLVNHAADDIETALPELFRGDVDFGFL